MNDKKKNRRDLRQRYQRAQTVILIRRGYTPAKARFIARQEADKICRETKQA